MSLKIDANMSAIAHHIEDGAVNFPYAIDAHQAVSHHPKEWSWTPWGKDGEKLVPMVDIPAGWEDLSPMQRIQIAVKLGADRKGLTAAKADELILAEVERREAETAE